MARYTGADCRRCRREKMKLFLKGSKCDGPKCPFESRPFPPGQHGRGRTKESEYLLQLREKQKARRIYGVLEKQFRTYYEEANRRSGKTGEELLKILESRLDNVVYRAGYAQSRDMARQLVKHGHFVVNGKKVDIPSYRVTEHDIIQVREKSAELTPFVVARAQAGQPGRAGLAGGDPEPDEDPDPLPAGPRVDRHAGPGATDRRALLQVVVGSPDVCKPGTYVRASNSGRPEYGGRRSAHLAATDSDRRVDQRDAVQVHDRAARAGVRLHARQLAPPYPAQLDPGRRR